jgi:chromosome segregation ATPase
MESHNNLRRNFEVNLRERDTDFARIKELEDVLDTRQSELDALYGKVDDYSAENGALRGQLSTNTRELTRNNVDENRRTTELQRQVKDKTGEVERLRSRLHEVEKQNADQDLQLIALKKGLEAKIEDFYQLNIALDAKQQELNMVRTLLLPSPAGILLTSGFL